MWKRPFLLVAFSFPSHLCHAPFSQKVFGLTAWRIIHISSKSGPLCLTLIRGPFSPIWTGCHSILQKLYQDRFWDIVPMLSVRWARLCGVLKWKKYQNAQQIGLSGTLVIELTETRAFAVLAEQNVFKATVKSRRFVKARIDPLQWQTGWHACESLQLYLASLSVASDQKLIRSRRAFSKAAFLTPCLCPFCFCLWADCKRLVPTLHCLIIILISMLPQMCIAEQNLASPQIKRRATKFSECVKSWQTPQERILLDGHGTRPFSPWHACDRQRGILTPNLAPCFLSAFSLAGPEISVVSGFLLHSLINSKCLWPAQAQCPRGGNTISSGLCLWPPCQAACTCSSMTFLRLLTLVFIMKVNRMLFILLQMPEWLNDTLRRHVQPCTFTAYLTRAIFPTKAFTYHLLSHDTTCQVLIRNVFDHPDSHSSFRNGTLNKTLSRFHTKGIMCISNVVN